MSALNTRAVKLETLLTAGGAKASKITPLQALERLTMSCMLWEDVAYASGMSIAEAISILVHTVTLEEASRVAIIARRDMHLRHVPLLIVREMARHPNRFLSPRVISRTLCEVIQRPDEITEFLAIYWKDEKQPLSKQVKLGISQAFSKFGKHALAKYNRDKSVKLRDAMFMCHVKPTDLPEGSAPYTKADRSSADSSARTKGLTKQEEVLKSLADNTLALNQGDTWETRLSAGEDKAQAFKELMLDFALGDLAFLRNLRNMVQAGVPLQLIRDYGHTRTWEKVLPFRFITAARYVPQLEESLGEWMMKGISSAGKLPGSTLLVVDVSGSMRSLLSSKSELNRLDAAAALTALAREVCEEPTIYLTAGKDYNRTHLTEVIPARRGFPLIDYICNAGYKKLGGGGIFLTQCINHIDGAEHGKVFDRVIVFTDEQDMDSKLNPSSCKLLGKNNYLVNISSEENGIGYERWTHVNGFSESILEYIITLEEGNTL